MTVDLPVLAALFGAALLIGVSKGGLAIGGPVLTILLSLAMPAKVAIGVMLPLLMVGDAFALWAHWGRWDRVLLLRLLPGGVLGVVVASFGLRSISERALQLVLVAVTVLFVAYKLVEPRLAGRSIGAGPRAGVVAGAASGVTSTIAHVGGPPISIYLLLTGTSSRSYVATSAVFFTVVNWLKVPGYLAAGLLDGALLVRVAPIALVVPPGILLGRFVVVRISQRTFDRFVLASLLAGAALLLLP